MGLSCPFQDGRRGGSCDGSKACSRGTIATDYEVDVYAWVRAQIHVLRASAWSPLDIEHLADEIADVGRSESHALTSALGVVLLHLLKWDPQPTST
jgi:hypothetical protein